jgi:tRNA/rRNA methyltransferase
MHAPIFVLVRPQMGENIGASARGMLNFGLETLRIVAPRDGWPNPRAVAMASGAGRLLDNAGLFGGVAGAVADCHHVYATTARPRELTRPVLTPTEAMRDARARISAGQRVAVLFGPERAGLENEDIGHAQTILTVDANPAFPSLNLAQCVLLAAYEWRREVAPAPVATEVERASAVEVQALADHMEQRLAPRGFFFPPEKSEPMRRNLRAMWARLELTRADVQTLHGILRKLAGRPGAADDPS